MIEQVRKEVEKILCNDNSGHGTDHIDRVLKLSLKFSEKEKANKEIVSLIALLHDVDDHKIFGLENSLNLTNAKRILNDCNVDIEIQEQVLDSINNIGYSKRLKGCIPESIEGKIVSDADMCDALGANGILRTYQYNIKKGNPFFDRSIFPIENLNNENYVKKSGGSSICHIFEKILKLKNLMLTNSGKEEALKRDKIVIDFLYQYFYEEDAMEWIDYLDKYLMKRK